MKKKNQNQRQNLALPFIFLLTVLMIVLVRNKLYSQRDNAVDIDQFSSVVGDNIRINSKLLITTESSVIDFSSKNWISFFVINESNETIAFSNIHFNLRIFQQKEITGSWDELEIAAIPMKKEIKLPPGDKYSNAPENVFSLNTDYFDIPTKETILRFFIFGKGDETGKLYGAYIDIPILLP